MLAQSSQTVTLVDDLSKYTGTDALVYNKADGKVYVLNSLNKYERYGVYEVVNSLKVNDPNGPEQETEYLKSPDGAYIDLGYAPKKNTKIEAVFKATNGPEWKALYGTRFEANTQNGVDFPGTDNYSEGNGWKHGFAFFPTNGAINLGGETVEKDKMVFDEKIKTVQDAATGKLEIYKGADLTELANTIEDSPLEKDCETPLYIFAINKHLPVIEGYNDDPERLGQNGDYCYNPYVELYSLKVYEGETLKFDLVPVVSQGKGALKDKVSNTIFRSANNQEFDVNLEMGIAVYEGKMVFNTTDNNVYKYTNGSFQLVGPRTVGAAIDIPEGFVDYRDMNNWETNNDHKSVFAGKIAYDAQTGWNTIDDYVGSGGWEPLMVKIATEAGQGYRLSYKYKSGVYNSWCDKEMRTYVVDFWDLGTLYGEGGQSGMANYILPFAGTNDQEVEVNLDFTPDNDKQNWSTLLWQFGLVNDNQSFKFAFGDIKVSKLQYPEAYPAVNPFGPLLAELIPIVEDYDGLTTEALKAKLDEALKTAKNASSSEEIAVQKAALEALQEAFDNVKALNANDIASLQKTIAIAKAEGIKTEEAEAFFVSGLTNDELGSVLKTLRIDRKQLHAERQSNVFKGNKPAAGDFYLYNVGQQRFLTGGSDWGAHAALGMPGTLITLEESEVETDFHLNTHLANGEQDGGIKEYLSYRGYMDSPKAGAWRFVETGEGSGVYNILQADYPDVYVKYNPNASVDGVNGDWTTVGTENHLPSEQTTVDPEELDAQWILVTQEERLALLKNATAENPVDASFLIVNPGFNQRAEVTPTWNIFGGSVWGRGDNHSDFALESWNETYCSFSTLVEGLNPGYYEISVQGFYRDGLHADQAKFIEEGSDALQNAYLYNGMIDINLPNITAEVNMAPGLGAMTSVGEYPDGIDQACQYFQNGLYRVSIVVEVDAKGMLDIGVEKDGQAHEGDWVVVDNFRLKYYGTTKPELNGIQDMQQTVVTDKMFNLQGVQLQKAPKSGLYIVGGKKYIAK